MANRGNTGPRREPNRPVKPRKTSFKKLPIIAIDRKHVLLENGEVHSFTDLPILIQSQPSSILVANHIGFVIKYLDEQLGSNPLWQFRASPVERTAWSPESKRKAILKDCVVGYLGFKGKNKKRGHFHYPLSPETFILKGINELRNNVPGETSTTVKLMEWAKEVRDFLDENQLRLSPTSGGIAAQFLRDKRFYPDARRKVPRHTNAKSREHLPGNFYELYAAKENRGVYNAAYLDQTSAHHSAALKIEFPSANTLYQKGRYSTLQDRRFANAGTPKFNRLIKEYGLFYLAIECPRFFENSFPLPNLKKEGGYQTGYFYSNELEYLKILGVRIRHIIACWTSPEKDPGLNRYAAWAAYQVSKSDSVAKHWLKPTLLSTYGVLASKPKRLEFGYKQAENGEPGKYPCGSGFLEVQVKASEKLREPLMANVIHRGMIEAQTRLESLSFARELAAEGHTILAIYADSIFVEDGKQLPLLPPLWRIQNFLTALRFESPTHFTSVQMSKTPGIPTNLRNRSRLPARPKRNRKTTTQK